MRIKKTKDGYVLVYDNEEEAKFAKRFITQGAYDEKHAGEDAYGRRKNPYDLNDVPGFRH